MNRLIIFFFLILHLAQSHLVFGQCVQPFDNWQDANCVFDEASLNGGLFTTSLDTNAWTPSTPVGFCGSVQYSIWFPVRASTDTMRITVSPTICDLGTGLQLALYKSPDAAPLACNPGISAGFAVPISVTVPPSELTPCGQYFILVDGLVGDQCEFTFDVEGLADSTSQCVLFEGQVAIDSLPNCILDSSDQMVNVFEVQAVGNQYSMMMPVDQEGKYAFYAPVTSAPMTVRAVVPNSSWYVCPDSALFTTITTGSSYTANFLASTTSTCPQMEVEVTMLPFLRICNGIHTSWVNYSNTGTVAATNASINYTIPTGYTYSSSGPIQLANQSGNVLQFDLGTVQPLTSGSFSINLLPPCDTTLLGQTLCFEATITPDTPCVVSPIYSGAKIELEATCIGDTTVQFKIKNTGTAPTTQLLEYIIIEDEVVLRQGNFSLNPGQETLFTELGDGSTFRIEAGQEPLFPVPSMPALSLEGCGGLTPGYVTAYFADDLAPAIDIECHQVVGAYDPNVKTASPVGLGSEHIIGKNIPIEYTIQFQNTGTDTAFRVMIVDKLPRELDTKTLRMGAASHPYTWSLFNHDSLVITFEPIALPDSNVNVVASQGAVQFTLQQMPNLPDGTRFENRASIYFDYLSPVITDPAYHTIGQLLVSFHDPLPDTDAWQVHGNPTPDLVVFTSQKQSFDTCEFTLIDGSGRVIEKVQFQGNTLNYHFPVVRTGTYFFQIGPKNGEMQSGKIIFIR
jgi:hypothetical protein